MSRNLNSQASTFSFIWKAAILILALTINLTLIVRLAWGNQSLAAWKDLKHHQVELQDEMQLINQRRADLSREIRLLQSDGAYVERIIRQRLNYVHGNELLYIFDEKSPEDSIWTGEDANAALD